MIALRTETELEKMKRSGEILRNCFLEVEKLVRPGITTGELDRVAEDFIRSAGAIPAFKGYQGFPATICASVNDQVVHGIPGRTRLKEGDIIAIDIGLHKDEYYADASRSYPVGEVSENAHRLLKVTREALNRGIDNARVGNHLFDISHAIQQHAESNGYQVVRVLVGHGVGKMLHEEPQVPNFGPPGEGVDLRAGMVLAIEPMVNEGTYEVYTLEDRWTYVTADGKLSAHFEDTVAVTDNGPAIMTR